MAHPNVHLARYIDIPTFLCYVLQTLQQLEYCTFLIIDGHGWSARWIGRWGVEQSWPQSVRIHCFYTLNGEFFGTVSLLQFLEWYMLPIFYKSCRKGCIVVGWCFTLYNSRRYRVEHSDKFCDLRLFGWLLMLQYTVWSMLIGSLASFFDLDG